MMALKSIPLYFLKHWRGELSLATSFWINIVALNLFVLGFIDPGLGLTPAPVIDLTFDPGPSFKMLVSFGFYIIDPHGILILEDPVFATGILLIWAVLKLGTLYPWQFVGLMRSCNRYVVEKDKTFWVSTAQLLAVIGIAGVVVNTNQHWPVYRGLYQAVFGAGRMGDYKVELIKNNTFIHLKGDIAWGVSNDVEKLLMQHSGIKGIILDSDGGWDNEGADLSSLVMTYRLDTYVLGGCYSACITAFISGSKRFLGRDAVLGFHQAGVSFPVSQHVQDSWDYNQEWEKENYRKHFEIVGMNHEFFNKMYDTPHDDMWIPTWIELFDSGLIHGIVESDLTPVYGIVLRFGVAVELGENWHVFKVYEHSIADRMQLQKGDVLLQWDDVKLARYDNFLDQFYKLPYDERFSIKIRRNNSILELESVLQQSPA